MEESNGGCRRVRKAGGCSCEAGVLFCGVFVDQNAFESWLGKLRGKLETAESEDEWSTHPLAARLCIFWKNCQKLPLIPVGGMSPGVQTPSLALVPAAGGGSRLTPSDHERFKRQLEKDYTSVVVTAETMPVRCYLKRSISRSRTRSGSGFRGAILSEEQLLEVKSRRSKTASDVQPDERDLTWWEVCSTSWRPGHTLSRWSMRATFTHGKCT